MKFLLSVCAVALIGVQVHGQDVDNKDAVRREQVLNSISLGQKALLKAQNRDGSWTTTYSIQYGTGPTALVTLSLINSGVSTDDEAIRRAINYIKNTDPNKTYDISMAIMAVVASKDNASEAFLRKMTGKLVAGQRKGPKGGNWFYGDNLSDDSWDNSNTQFAVLALSEAAHYGIQVDRKVWELSKAHFLGTQVGNVKSTQGAGWPYRDSGQATGSMTVAGLASLIICDAMLQDDSKDVGVDGTINCCMEKDGEVEQSIAAGVQWLASNFSVRSNPSGPGFLLYYLYGLERAGRFSGQRFFGEHDWYREGVDFLVPHQGPSGVWRSVNENDETVGTSLALLFLAKGLSPVLINKLKYGPRDPQTHEVIGKDWNRHGRDINNLVDYTTTIDRWPKILSWQMVDLRNAAEGEGVSALLQSPIQYLSGSEDLDSIQGKELELLRDYIAQGGFIFAVQNCESADFEIGIKKLVQRIFEGQYELVKLPSTHDVYRSEAVLTNNPPELWGVDFGCRTAIIYAPFDHACRWNKWVQHPSEQRHQQVNLQVDKSMKLGLNVIAYATGRELHDKLKRPDVLLTEDANKINRGRLTIARLRHTGGWDTAPHALKRLQAALATVGIDSASESPTLPANDPALFDYPLVYMHGRKNFQLSDEEKNKLLAYLSNGGFLFADACCGSSQFDDSFRELVLKLYNKPLEKIPGTHELHNMQLGYDIRSVTRRLPARDAGGSSLATSESVGEAILEGIQIDGKYVIVYSKYDLSCALERQASTACAGYASEDAAKIGVNLVLYGLFQ